MVENDSPRQSGRRRPEENVFDWFVDEWRKRYGVADSVTVDEEIVGEEVLSVVCEENCLDPNEVSKLSDAARQAVREEVGLELLPSLHDIPQVS